MSGGSMDFLYSKVESASFSESTPLRRAFRTHLALVAMALHDIEWVDCGDFGRGQEEAAIRACLSKGAVLALLVEDAERVKKELSVELALVQERAGKIERADPKR